MICMRYIGVKFKFQISSSWNDTEMIIQKKRSNGVEQW